jgi:nitronate monooxygenase
VSVLDGRVPIVQAPLGGGPSTPRLAAAVAQAGGLGFLAAGYKTAEAVAADINGLRSLTREPFGVNMFAPPEPGGSSTGSWRSTAPRRRSTTRTCTT